MSTFQRRYHAVFISWISGHCYWPHLKLSVWENLGCGSRWWILQPLSPATSELPQNYSRVGSKKHTQNITLKKVAFLIKHLITNSLQPLSSKTLASPSLRPNSGMTALDAFFQRHNGTTNLLRCCRWCLCRCCRRHLRRCGRWSLGRNSTWCTWGAPFYWPEKGLESWKTNVFHWKTEQVISWFHDIWYRLKNDKLILLENTSAFSKAQNPGHRKKPQKSHLVLEREQRICAHKTWNWIGLAILRGFRI